jgi:hypothetical protein
MNNRLCQTGGEDRTVILTTKFFLKNPVFLSAITFTQPAKNIALFSKAGCKDKRSFCSAKSFSTLFISHSPEMLCQQGFRAGQKN